MGKDIGILARRINGTLVLSGACFRIHMNLKTIAGWQYDPITKRWTIPESGVAAFLGFAAAKETPVTWVEDDAATGATAPPTPVPAPVTPAPTPAPANAATGAPTPATAAPGSLEGRIIELIHEHAAPAGTGGVDR